MENEAVVTEKKGLSIASMVLGIVSIITYCIFFVSIPCSILAIIFAIIGKNKGGKGMAIAGLVCGIIGLAVQIYVFVVIGATMSAIL